MSNIITGLLPRRSDYAGLSRSWRGDVMAGITVGVVALPLALAFGITTGLGAAGRADHCDRRRTCRRGLRRLECAGLGPNWRDDGGAGAGRGSLRHWCRVPLGDDGWSTGAARCVGPTGPVPGLHSVAGDRRVHRRDRLHHLSPTGAGRAGCAQAGGGEHRRGRVPGGARCARGKRHGGGTRSGWLWLSS